MRTLIVLYVLSAIIITAPVTLRAQTIRERRNDDSPENIRMRFEYDLKKRNNEYRPDLILQAKEQIKRQSQNVKQRTPLDAGIWNWEWLGPGNIGGRVEDVLIHPANPNLMWIASPGGGIWHTTDGGAAWLPIDDFLPMMNVVSLAMDPTNDQIMYAGTGEYAYFGLPANGRRITGVGLFKSINGGASWFLLPSTMDQNFYYISRIAHNPRKANTLLIATQRGIYRSADGGATWTLVLDTFNAIDVRFHPFDTTKVLAATDIGIYRSTNGGTNWKLVSNDTSGLPFILSYPRVALAASNSNIMYISTRKIHGEVYQSTNGGDSWVQRNVNIADSVSVNFYTNAIWVSPTDPNFVVVGGTEGVHRSTDGGINFSLVSDWGTYNNGNGGTSAHGDEHVIVNHPGFDGVTNNTVYFGNDGGIQYTANIKTVSRNSGWINLAHNLGITQFYGGAASPDGQKIVGGTQDLAIANYYQAQGPQGWWNPITGDGGFCAIDYRNSGYIYSETQWLSVLRSDDGGGNYASKVNGLLDAVNPDPSTANALFIAPLVMHPDTPSILFAGGRSIWKTTNRGDSWNSIHTPIPSGALCSAIDIAPGKPIVIWTGYDDGSLYRTFDGGGLWLESGLPSGGNHRFITDIAINPNDDREVIVTVGGYDTNTVWLSTNSGGTWTKRTGMAPNQLPAIQVNTVRYHPLDPDWIYVGTDIGVFASEDKGNHWSITPASTGNEGPANTVVEELFWQGTSYLLAATHGRGMYRCKPLPIVYVDASYFGPEDGSQFQPYNTVGEAIAAYGPGALLSIKSATYNEGVLHINKRGRIRSTNGSSLIK